MEPSRRPWTRLGIATAAAHLFYELASGVGMPLASRIGPGPAAATWAAGGAITFRRAGTRPRTADGAFSLLNVVLLTAVIAHFTAWPRRWVAGTPWLTECEGLSGRLMPPYNLMLYVSAIAAIGGLVENGRPGPRATAVPAVGVPVLVVAQRRQLARVRQQARDEPGWWNRRLQPRSPRRGRPLQRVTRSTIR